MAFPGGVLARVSLTKPDGASYAKRSRLREFPSCEPGFSTQSRLTRVFYSSGVDKQMTLDDILQRKGYEVFTIASDVTLEEVVQTLVDKNCGSLLIRDAQSPDAMAGIITERDILRTTAATRKPLDEICVAEVMSVNLITGSPGDCIEMVMGLMTQKRIRHLPVIEGGDLRGMISIGDIVKAKFDEMATENHFLKTYIQG
jgi:CBS domain-containing protein